MNPLKCVQFSAKFRPLNLYVLIESAGLKVVMSKSIRDAFLFTTVAFASCSAFGSPEIMTCRQVGDSSLTQQGLGLS